MAQLCVKGDQAEQCVYRTQKLKLSMGLVVCGREAGTEGYQEPCNARSKSYGKEPAERTESHE